MFASVLIANRGEIACRIIRTARRLGLRCVAVYSDADADALHVRLADEAYRLGPAPAAGSYLAIDRVIDAARSSGAECIHPGYGFLAENATFAQACGDAGVSFVGPPPDAIRAMGQKDRAKALMLQTGVPVVPGYHGERQEPGFLKQKAYEIGYPVLIKAVAGGGGKGMRRVDRHADFDDALNACRREAQSAFSDGRVLIEKYIAGPRHVEFQIFADSHGHVIHLGERDCSLQRRHQKVIEEAPAPGMTADLRAVMGEAAIAAARVVGYEGAGTVEFIADGQGGVLKADGFWFMEMNTRLQVEHPVTESITGLDLVEWQFRVTAGETLPLAQHQVSFGGHAAEARLCAEDPERDFLPSTGPLVALQFPQLPGLRIDSGVTAGDRVTPYYDPMLAKLIAHGTTRAEALDILADALDATVVAGPRSNAAFLAALARAGGFRRGNFDTGFIDANLDRLGASVGFDRAAAAFGARELLGRESARIALAVAHEPELPASPWDAGDAFQLSGTRRLSLPLIADGETVVAQVDYGAGGPRVVVDGEAPAADAVAIPSGDAIYVLRRGRQTRVSLRDVVLDEAGDAGDGGLVCAPMHGKVLTVLVEEGATVSRGQRLAIVEAMKMEHTLTAPIDGVVADIAVAADMQVAEGARIMTIRPADSRP
jgi:3-methylcrotonyl-CoA carboxylase alpha subunit